MALTKATYGMISADTSTIDLNIDANTLYVDSSANRVGIGTDSPSDSLSVNGHISLGTASNKIYNGSSADSAGMFFAGSTLNLSGYADIVLRASTTNITVQTERLRVKADTGRVGIGETSPSELLHVKGTNSAIAIDGNGANNTASIKFINDNERSRITSSYDTGGGGRLTFHTDTTGGSLVERMRITNAGKVGIGNNNPVQQLDVVGAIRVNSAGDRKIDFLRTSGNHFSIEHDTAQIYFYNHTTSEAGIKIRNDGNVIMDAGNVSIGAGNSPDKLLHLKTAVNNTAVMRIESTASNSYPHLEFKNDARTYGIYGAHGGLNDAFSIYDGTAGAHRLTIDTGGEVGIGTTEPNYPLDVYGTNDLQMRIHRPSSSLGLNDTCGIGFSQRGDANTSTTDTRAAIVSTYNGSLHLCTEPGGNLNTNPADHAALSIVGTDQNVGIGTTSPNHPLSVSAANAKIVAHSTADSQTIGFHAKYLDHATLYGSFEYTTGDAQLYIDNHFAGNNAAYSTINFRNCNNNNNTLQTRMSIAGSTGMVTVNNRLRVANAGTATAGTVALEVLGNRNDSVVPANASAKFYAYSDGDGLALGNYTSSPYGSYLQAGYLLDSYGTAYNNGYPITLNPVGGNVGIGACGKDPLDILHIERSVNGAVQIQVDNQNTGNASYAGLYLNGQGNSFYLKNWGDSVSGKSNVTEFNTTASNQYMIFTPGNTHNLSLFNDESEFGSTTADSKLTINPPNTSNAKTKTSTVIGFYHYYKTSPGAAYAHMKTNMPTGGNTGTFGMIAIEATGYKYNTGDCIKGMWGFHNWNSGTYQQVAANLISSSSNGFNFCSGTYVSSDGYIVLVANSGGTSSVYLGARLDFIDIQADYARHSSAYWPPAVTAISWSNNSTGVY